MTEAQPPTHRFAMRTTDGEDVTPQFRKFAETIGLEQFAPGRYSTLLLVQLYAATTARLLNPWRVTDEIRALEGHGTSQTKPAEMLRGPLLRGLWHKHHTIDGLFSMAKNLENALRTYGVPLFEQRAQEAAAASEERFMTPEDINALVHDVTTGNFERRAAAHKMTGEWLVFVPHEGQNYYLSLGRHDNDENLRQDIETVCFSEFPFIVEILTTAQITP